MATNIFKHLKLFLLSIDNPYIPRLRCDIETKYASQLRNVLHGGESLEDVINI